MKAGEQILIADKQVPRYTQFRKSSVSYAWPLKPSVAKDTGKKIHLEHEFRFQIFHINCFLIVFET